MTHAPSFAHGHARGGAPSRRRGEWLALTALVVALAAQLGWLEREQMAANPQLRPAMESLCKALHCTLPPWHEPTAITMLARDVIAQPDHPGVLRVQASFRNDARWPQPWPALALSLSDVNARPLGARRFQPVEYLGNGSHPAQLEPGQAVTIGFDIIEPAPNVVAFDFRFE